MAGLIDRHLEEIQGVLARNLVTLVDAPLPVAVRALVKGQILVEKVNPRLHRVLIEQVPRVERLDPTGRSGPCCLAKRLVDPQELLEVLLHSRKSGDSRARRGR